MSAFSFPFQFYTRSGSEKFSGVNFHGLNCQEDVFMGRGFSLARGTRFPGII